MQRHQGLISAADMKNYKVVERQPVKGSYRGYEVMSMPPPSSGGTHIIQMLNMLEAYPIRQQGVNSAQNLHLMAEVMKLAYADRSEYLGDPDFSKIPLQGLTSKAYARNLIQKSILNRPHLLRKSNRDNRSLMKVIRLRIIRLPISQVMS